MATYTTFLKNYRLQRYQGAIQLFKKSGINFGVQSLDAASDGGGVHEVISVQSGWIVLNAWINVDVACPAYSTVDLGYGSVVNQWGKGLLLDSVGSVRTALTATKAVYPPDKIFGVGEQFETVVDVPGARFGDLVSVSNMNNAGMGSATLEGYVIGDNRVGINIINTSEGELSLPTLSLDVVVSKAPMVGHPVMFDSKDTIDIKATTDIRDVDIDSGNITVYALIFRP